MGGDKTDHREDILRLAGQSWVAASVNYRLLIDHWQNRFPPRSATSGVRFAGSARTQRSSAGIPHASSRSVTPGGRARRAAREVPGRSGARRRPMRARGVRRDRRARRLIRSREPLHCADSPIISSDYIGRDGDWLAREALGSPLLHVDAHTAPTLLIHGQDDGTVPIAQSRAITRDARCAMRDARSHGGPDGAPRTGPRLPVLRDDDTQPYGACSTLSLFAHM